jgi:general secretion pathway protein G
VIKNYLKKEGGFTLLELLIVIVIIGILALLIIPNLTSAPKKARDVQRKTDLRAIQKGLEEYFLSYSTYPAALTALTSGNPPIIKAIPADPLNTGVFVYTYTAGTGNSSYTLKGCLENGGDTGQYTNTDATCTGTTRNFQLVNNN